MRPTQSRPGDAEQNPGLFSLGGAAANSSSGGRAAPMSLAHARAYDAVGSVLPKWIQLVGAPRSVASRVQPKRSPKRDAAKPDATRWPSPVAATRVVQPTDPSRAVSSSSPTRPSFSESSADREPGVPRTDHRKDDRARRALAG